MTTPIILRIDDLPTSIHLLTVNKFILLPETTLPLVLTDAKYAKLAESLAETEGYLGFILAQGNEGRGPEFQAVGCLARIRDLERGVEGLNVLFEGVIRFRVVREIPPAGKGDLPRAEVEYGEFAADLQKETEEVEGWNLERIKAALLQIGRKEMPRDLKMLEAMPPRQIIRLMAQTMPFSPTEKQALLEAPNFRALLELLFELLAVNFLTTTPDDPRARVN
ncbi:MAG TPA: LON peptidase substrate-binding domain-containing protein [Thermoanaerobaculia bacterium]|nr:LON peptidase substrate-binding domain-containing protein [Thermoanaerobaculia bacterium]